MTQVEMWIDVGKPYAVHYNPVADEYEVAIIVDNNFELRKKILASISEVQLFKAKAVFFSGKVIKLETTYHTVGTTVIPVMKITLLTDKPIDLNDIKGLVNE